MRILLPTTAEMKVLYICDMPVDRLSVKGNYATKPVGLFKNLVIFLVALKVNTLLAEKFFASEFFNFTLGDETTRSRSYCSQGERWVRGTVLASHVEGTGFEFGPCQHVSHFSLQNFILRLLRLSLPLSLSSSLCFSLSLSLSLSRSHLS